MSAREKWRVRKEVREYGQKDVEKKGARTGEGGRRWELSRPTLGVMSCVMQNSRCCRMLSMVW